MNASPFRRVVLQRYFRQPRAPRCASVGIFAAHSEWCEKRPVCAERFRYGGASCGVLSKSLSFSAHARRVARILRHPRAPRCASVGTFAAHSEWCEKRPVSAGRFRYGGTSCGVLSKSLSVSAHARPLPCLRFTLNSTKSVPHSAERFRASFVLLLRFPVAVPLPDQPAGQLARAA